MLIIATVEKYLITRDHIKKLILTGADALRFNLSYRTTEENLNYITIAQQVIDELNSTTKTFIDFPINKIRLGDFEARLFPVNEGDELILKSGDSTFDCSQYIPVNTSHLGEKLKIGQSVTIGDGEVSIQITDIIDLDTVRAKAQNKGVIQYMKTFNIPTTVDEEQIIKSYTEIIQKFKDIDHHYLAISYFNFSLWKRIYNEIILREKIHSKIVVKIENDISLDEIEALCNSGEISMLLVDRGELGVNMPYYQLGIYQKQIFAIAKKYKKPVIVSTQLLESTINNYIPNRAEILDLTNSVLEGAGGIMLCRETAINPRAAYTISVAKKIIAEAEKYKIETNNK